MPNKNQTITIRVLGVKSTDGLKNKLFKAKHKNLRQFYHRKKTFLTSEYLLFIADGRKLLFHMDYFDTIN